VITGLKAPRIRIPYGVAYAAAAVDTLIEGALLHREPQIPLEGVKMARKYMYFSPARAVKELGLPQSPVDQALERAVVWFRDNGFA